MSIKASRPCFSSNLWWPNSVLILKIKKNPFSFLFIGKLYDIYVKKYIKLKAMRYLFVVVDGGVDDSVYVG